MTDYEFESTPEDAWDHDDPIPDLVHNVCVRCALLDRGPRLPEGPGENTVVEMMNELLDRVRTKLRDRDLSDFDRHRAELLLEDARFILARVGGT